MPAHEPGERRPATTLAGADFDEKVRRFICSHKGAEQAVTLSQVADWVWEEEWKYGSERVRKLMARAVKKSVQRLRNRPYMLAICAARGARIGGKKYDGYFLAASQEEIELSMRSMKRQAMNMLRTIACMKRVNIRLIEDENGQGRLLLDGAGLQERSASEDRLE